MVTGRARELQARDPRKVRVVYERPRWHEAWEGNPRIARLEEQGDFQEYRPRDGYKRPYIAEKNEQKWTWRSYQPPRGELYFSAAELAFGDAHRERIVFEIRIKPGASPNKDWGKARWVELLRMARKRGLRIAQLGPIDKYKLDGAEFIVTSSMRLAAAVIARARVIVVPEGGMHHVAAATGTPAVVIFGGYIAPSVTGYAGQRNLFTGGGLGCGMRVKCQHCARAMADIEPSHVLQQLEESLETSRRSVAA